MEPLLQLTGIHKSFPGVRALDDIHFTLKAGEIHALLGENGAGKSTLMKVLCGIYQPDGGEIRIDGRVQRFRSYRDAIDAGVGIIFQEFSLIPELNAVENIFLNRELRTPLGLLDRRAMRTRTAAIFKRLGIAIDPGVPVESLSVAQQQFVEIAKALALEARILVLDEPTATLTPGEAEHLFSVMRDLQLMGVGMVFISHHLEEIFSVCDAVTVLRDGGYIGTVTTPETDSARLVEMMVGRRVEQTFPPKDHPVDTATTLLEASLQPGRGARPIEFQLHPGEILGFAGLVGSGRTETVEALIGARPCWRKTVRLNGREIRLRSPADALAQGIGLLPESRKTGGLVLSFSVARNITLNKNARWLRWFVHGAEDRSQVAKLIERVGVRTPDADTEVNTLSGGNQQKVVIARWLNHDCRVLIFDEPTRGIDVGAKAEIYQLMRQLTRKGIAIIMISSELPEVIGVCDRVLVFRGGEVAAELSGPEIDAGTIMLQATGNAS
ncbi:sugar ABC transporter ATP-binding protein [Enterobacteriaceae bacterium BIT-l23]|uniref:sugar ABC transporter ATP-binding protein n=1 Tax=Jejubacter sp. L23 TaxID=3092086 RepID=UPI001584924C|nr:sugar ABC transporter ATP-binding protein [Enterobacteriaceae bacterium BIT-l23]